MRSKRTPPPLELLSQLLLWEPDDSEQVTRLAAHPLRGGSVGLTLHVEGGEKHFRLEAWQARDLAALLLVRRGSS